MQSSVGSSVGNSVGGSPRSGEAGGKETSFGVRSGAAVSTIETPNIVTSRKAYLPASGIISAASGFEYSLDGGAWTAEAGVWGVTECAQMRFASSDQYATIVTNNLVVGGVNYPFSVVTMVDPMEAAFAHYTDQENYTEVDNYVDSVEAAFAHYTDQENYTEVDNYVD